MIAADAATTAWWVAPGVIAAAIAATVAVLTLVAQSRRSRTDRQRVLMADAFGDIATYCEYPYIVRRRSGTREDRETITNDLSEIQKRLNRNRFVLEVEAPRVGRAYVALLAQVREIAGASIRAGWDQAARTPEEGVNVNDVDLTAIVPYEKAFLTATADHLSMLPWWLRATGRWVRRMVRGNSRP